jgi:Tfp pilus assembly protein PilF
MEETILEGSENSKVMEDAERIIEQAVEVAGKLVTNKPQSAELILKQLLKCDPEHEEALQLLGLANHRMGKNVEAVEIFQTAIELDPVNADNWNNIALAHGGLGQHEKAIECLEKAIQYNASQFLYLNNLALQYRACDRQEDAIATLNNALAIKVVPQVLINLGGVYGEVKDLDKAKECFEKALEVAPEYSPAHVDLAYTHCLKGDWAKGFAEYEWRFDYHPQLSHYRRNYLQDREWEGQSLEGKKILIYCEQGMGDAIQFVRFVPLLKQQGAYVMLHCTERLHDLLERCEGVDQIVHRDIVNDKGPDFPEYDYQCAIMSLPHLLEMPPISGQPYIKPATTKFWDHMEKEHGDTFNIGISWAGSAAHPNDERRSIPLKHFKLLESVEGVQLFSLQVDARKRKYGWQTYAEGSEQLSNFQEGNSKVVDYTEDCDDMQIVDLTQMIQSYEDTATILAGLDLVICCDTSVLHLAGAMGVPCWGLLPFNPDWRWQIDGETTVWYDSVRLFRQVERNNWPEVFARVREELNEAILQNKRQELS